MSAKILVVSDDDRVLEMCEKLASHDLSVVQVMTYERGTAEFVLQQHCDPSGLGETLFQFIVISCCIPSDAGWTTKEFVEQIRISNTSIPILAFTEHYSCSKELSAAGVTYTDVPSGESFWLELMVADLNAA